MALDHYVPQVHLRNFYSPAFDGRMMYAIRKSDLKRFPTRSKDVCRIEQGNTNEYLRNSRVIEEVLRLIEPKYSVCLNKIRAKKIDEETVFSIAGFVACVIACSPTMARLGRKPIKVALETTTTMLDRNGFLPAAPASLGGKSLPELIADGTVHIDVDAKYPQALTISNVLDSVSIFGNSSWEILLNDESQSPFFTSDFPAAIEVLDPKVPINRIVPLAPDVAVRISPRVPADKRRHDFDFNDFKCVYRRVRGNQVREINRQIVQCAEDLVFFRDDHRWIEKFIARNREYWIETLVDILPSPTSVFQLSRMRITRRPPPQ